MRVVLSSVLLFGAGLSTLPAATTTLNFDSIPLSGGACVNGAPYLATFGVTFVPVSIGASSVICDATFAGSAAIPSSPKNIFEGTPPVTLTNVSYELLFATPLLQLSFVRTGIVSVSGIPPWQIFAYNASSVLLDSASEPFLLGPAAKVFTLNGPGIVKVHVDAFNSIARTTFNHPPLDDFKLVTADVPEPSTLMLTIFASSARLETPAEIRLKRVTALGCLVSVRQRLNPPTEIS